MLGAGRGSDQIAPGIMQKEHTMWSLTRTAGLAGAAVLCFALSLTACALPGARDGAQVTESEQGWVYAPGDDATSGSEKRIIKAAQPAPSGGPFTAKQQK